jgi:hypothetical protein
MGVTVLGNHLADRLEKAASDMVARQQGQRTGSLRRTEAIELELLLRDAAVAIATNADLLAACRAMLLDRTRDDHTSRIAIAAIAKAEGRS